MGALPQQLIDEIDSYLPPDPAILLQGYKSAPSWLHGDVTHDNMFVSCSNSDADSTSSAAMNMIDFGDAGHGDPIYDFVAASISTLKCKEKLLRCLWRAYLSSTQCSLRERGMASPIPLSKVANCYMLLHEDNPVGRIFQLRPEVRHVRTLTDLQLQVWDFLDEH